MKRLLLLVFVALPVLAGISSCGHDQSPVEPETPSLVRAPQPSATAVSDTDKNSVASQGNFEGLVADYESKDRVIWQKPGMVISLLGDLEGKTVADIGAGSGFFAFRMVPKARKVLAIDIDPRFITFMDSVKVRLDPKYQERFETRLAQPDNPRLHPGEADAVIIVNTYGYIEKRLDYLKTLRKGMSDGARLLIIDFKKNNLPIGPPEEYKVALSRVEQELQAAGFRVTKIDKESLDYQYIVLAEKTAAQ